MTEHYYKQVYDSEIVGSQMGNAVEELFWPKLLLLIRDDFLESLYSSQLESLTLTYGKKYIDSFGKNNGIRGIRFDFCEKERLVEGSTPEKNSVIIKWSKQVEWAKTIKNRGLLANLEKGDDWVEANITLMMNNYLLRVADNLRNVQQKKQNRFI